MTYNFFARISHDFTQHPDFCRILAPLLSWDRVINRHSGERAAYGSRVWLSRRAEFP
jgi:hypothetical protein